jgi:hypothetical protein
VETKTKAPGLTWPRGKPIWRASRAAIKASFKPTWVNLGYFSNDEAALVARCHRLTAEQDEWLGGIHGRQTVFDGTIRSVIRLWQTDQTSPYHRIEASTRHPYDSYARMIDETVGARRVDRLDSADLQRWNDEWSAPKEEGGKPRLAAARMARIVLKNALTFAKGRRKPGCAELLEIFREMKFAGPRPRIEAPTKEQIIAARKAAHSIGHPIAALAYALQFEGTVRQWDVIGKWVPLTDKKPSTVIDGNQKWVGPMWAVIDEHLILRYTPAKTQFTSGAQVALDLKLMPMVMEELAKVPMEARRGPLIVNPRTGLPYRGWYYGRVWDKVRKLTGIPKTVWNRDLRAAGVTEAREADATNADVAKSIGDTERTTAKVYDRARLAAARRVSHARVAHRDKNGE